MTKIYIDFEFFLIKKNELKKIKTNNKNSSQNEVPFGFYIANFEDDNDIGKFCWINKQLLIQLNKDKKYEKFVNSLKKEIYNIIKTTYNLEQDEIVFVANDNTKEEEILGVNVEDLKKDPHFDPNHYKKEQKQMYSETNTFQHIKKDCPKWTNDSKGKPHETNAIPNIIGWLMYSGKLDEIMNTQWNSKASLEPQQIQQLKTKLNVYKKELKHYCKSEYLVLKN